MIVQAALNTWSRDYFAKTALSSVASALSVTKPALYRHFRNKEALIESLNEHFAQRMHTRVVQPLECVDTAELPELAAQFIRTVGEFFSEEPSLFALLAASVFRRASDRRSPYVALFEVEAKTLAPALEKTEYDRWRRGQVLRFVNATTLFWTTQRFRENLPIEERIHRFDASGDTATQRDAEIRRAIERCSRGFVCRTENREPDWERVEQMAWSQPHERPNPHRILSAIEEVVSEVGFADATVERIADRVGVTKSTLYSHFRDRGEMLTKMMVREQHHFLGLARDRLSDLHSPLDRLYGLVVLMGSQYYHNPTQLTVRNWLRQRQLEVHLPKAHMAKMTEAAGFILELVSEASSQFETDETLPLLAFTKLVVKGELDEAMHEGIEKEELLTRLRSLFGLFAFGLERFDTQKEVA